ncbi:putative RNA dependent RNA polymerase [Rice gall dwarf virus]|uniref:RNA-directed RNA polymerase P1 n=1 Tax=Rice gall dwarf virus TaxID=10986 RepID=RDRP_RGDV|nr:putative RNA dependent RNA polymerase [Rice gall dwarf virus]A4PBP6.1 RecName: Full=RNA-directed RNA polymerase P1; AltName: Full=Replicase [Rice gall dwarf virus]BAF49639.1 putative RNA dependent RNA polymerase [Rice gall dwarf virus]
MSGADVESYIFPRIREILTGGISGIREAYINELRVCEKLIQWRNGSDNQVDSTNDASVKGMVFHRVSERNELQNRYAGLYDDLFKLNNNNVDIDVITKHDETIDKIISKELKSKMWYELNDEDIHSSLLPEFQIQTLDDYYDNMKKYLSQDDRDEKGNDNREEEDVKNRNDNVTRIQWQTLMEKDRKVKLHDDLSFSNEVETSLSTYINLRTKEEMDPRYVYHPVPALFITLTLLKVLTGGKAFSYGVRYLEKLCKTISKGERSLATYPAIFGSNGELVATRLYSHYAIKMRLILNNMTYLLTYKSCHEFKDFYIDVNDEVLLYMLENPNGGRDLKKAVTRLNLYYGLRYNPKTTDSLKIIDGVDYHHEHPKYSDRSYDAPIIEPENHFSASEQCYEHNAKLLNQAVYSKTVKEYIDSDIKKVKDLNLPLLTKFTEKLVDMRCNKSIIYDIVFMRTLLNMGGYSRSNQITDFKGTIDDITKMNDEYLSDVSEGGKRAKMSEWMYPKMEACGYGLTKSILNGQMVGVSYPSASESKAHIESYITPNSAGIGNLRFDVDVGGKMYKVRTTSKSAFVNALGTNIFNIDTISMEPMFLSEYLTHLNQDEKMLLYDRRKNRQIQDIELMRLCGQNVIGSRSTTAWRPVRPIYINVIQAHLAQAFIIGPHINATVGRQRTPPKGLWFTGEDVGIGFATIYQNGTSDVISHAIEASASGRCLSVLADCSSWDQTFLTESIIPYYQGIKRAISEFGQADSENYYMYDNQRKDVVGMRLTETIDWFNEYQKKRIFNASYLGERYSFKVQYMWSGRLDTFFMNSVQNALITERIANQVSSSVAGSPSLVWFQVAGDDAIMVYNANSITSSDQVDAIRKTVVDEYTADNHIINPQKTVISHISGEYAKIYYYAGMHFRDPSIQLHESEKISKATNITEVMRGYAQVAFEYNKRAIGSLRINSLYARLLASLAYSINVKRSDDESIENKPNRRGSKAKARSTKTNNLRSFSSVKYYPPLTSVITPTGVKGGLGMSLSGISLNEILMIKELLLDLVEAGLKIVDQVSFEQNEIVSKSLMRHFLRDRKDLIKEMGLDKGTKPVMAVRYRSSDSAFSSGNFENGISMRLESLDSHKLSIARQSEAKLKSVGVNLPKMYTYENLPYSTINQSLKGITIDKDLSRMTNSDLVDQLRSIPESECKGNLISKYPVYGLFNARRIISMDEKVDNPIRYISTPDEGKALERLIGSRTGIQFKNQGYGGSPAIVRFIRRNGLTITEENLIDLVISSGAISLANPKQNMIELFQAISGDQQSSLELANFFMNEKPHWEDKAISITINGSILENCDSRISNISRFVSIDAIRIPGDIKKMFTYIAYVYMCQMFILDENTPSKIHISINEEQLRDFLISAKPISKNRMKQTIDMKFSNQNSGVTIEIDEESLSRTADLDYEVLKLVHPLSVPFLRNLSEGSPM